MGTTVAGNRHAGTVYIERQYVWAQGLGGDYQEVELFEEDGFYAYQFNPLYDQRDDGVWAVEFYFYYHKPDTQAFWTYVYDPDRYYIVPFLAWYYDEGNVGQFGGLCSDAPKISLVGRESGWIHVTLHMDEAIYGQYVTSQGTIGQNPLYFGVYSPLLNFCYDSSLSDGGPVVPYHLEFGSGDDEDYEMYDYLTGGYMEDLYWRRRTQGMYPSFYITYRDVTPESFAYSVNEAAVMNVTSGIARKAEFKKLLQEIKAALGTPQRNLLAKRNCGNEDVSFTDLFSRRQDYKRLFEEAENMDSLCNRKHGMCKDLIDSVIDEDISEKYLLLMRQAASENVISDSTAKKARWFRQLETMPGIETEVERQQILFRALENQINVSALPFASRLFFRTVQTVMRFWDWLRGKIREANNVASFYCPIWTEIELECRI